MAVLGLGRPDEPAQGPDGDVVIQSFYLVSPLRFAFDPEFSEVDWEYLPNGGWGSDATRLYGITWQTVRLEPWQAFNQSHEEPGSLNGWHVLMMQIADGKTRLVGDVAFKEVAEVAGAITPVPGGVGQMTVACLLVNTLRAACAIHGLAKPAV